MNLDGQYNLNSVWRRLTIVEVTLLYPPYPRDAMRFVFPGHEIMLSRTDGEKVMKLFDDPALNGRHLVAAPGNGPNRIRLGLKPEKCDQPSQIEILSDEEAEAREKKQ